jgi:DNA repair exonuclease SbcCD ATPase subunit
MDIEKGNIKIHKTISEILKKEISLYDEGKCPTCSTDFKSEHFVNLRNVLEEKKNTHIGILEEIQVNIINKRKNKLN